jgi:hypothetical protein
MNIDIIHEKKKFNIKYNGVVKYGIPSETNKRTDGSLSNAEILAILEAGSEVNNLPPRPLLEPVREKHKEQIDKDLMLACYYIFKGEEQQADTIMQRLAFKMETWTKAYFTEDNGWAPNSPITIHGGWMANKKTGKPFYVKGKGSDRPMIDTGELRRSIRGVFIKDT